VDFECTEKLLSILFRVALSILFRVVLLATLYTTQLICGKLRQNLTNLRAFFFDAFFVLLLYS